MEFNVGDIVNVDGLIGTVICISMGDLLGVQFDEDYSGHRCLGIPLKAGSPSPRTNNCWWVRPENATRLEEVVDEN